MTTITSDDGATFELHVDVTGSGAGVYALCTDANSRGAIRLVTIAPGGALTDVSSGTELADRGAEFNVYALDGTFVEEVVAQPEGSAYPYLTSWLPDGSYYAVQITAPTGYQLNPAPVIFDAARASDGVRSASLGHRPEAPGSVLVRFSDGADPVIGLVMTLVNEHGTFIDAGQTDASGHLLFRDVAPGSYLLRYTDPGGFTDSFEGDLQARSVDPVLPHAQTVHDIVLTREAPAAGHSVFHFEFTAPDGTELPGVEFDVWTNDAAERTFVAHCGPSELTGRLRVELTTGVPYLYRITYAAGYPFDGTAEIVIPANGVNRWRASYDSEAPPKFAAVAPYAFGHLPAPWAYAWGGAGLDFPTNLLDADTADLETSAAGWTAYGDAVASRSTAQAATGSASLALTAGPDGTLNAASTDPVPVVPGVTYSFGGSSYPTALNRRVDWALAWYNADESQSDLVSTWTPGPVVVPGAWTPLVASATAPDWADHARLMVRCGGIIADGEVCYFDAMFLADAGRLGLPVPGDGTDSGVGLQWYDLTNSSVYVQATPPTGAGTTVYQQMSVLAYGSPDNRASIRFEDGNLIFRMTTGGVDDDVLGVLTYDPTAHAFWRIRELAHALYWDTSPDGVTWTNQRATAHTIEGFATSILELSAGSTDTEAATAAYFDNLNTH